jgi:hypothetical protein
MADYYSLISKVVRASIPMRPAKAGGLFMSARALRN